MRSVPHLKGQRFTAGPSAARPLPRVPSYLQEAGGRLLRSHLFLGAQRSRRGAAEEVHSVRRRALTARRFRAREARGREFPKGSTSQGPSGGRRESSGLEDRVLDRSQSPISRGTSSRSLPSVGLGFPSYQPSSSHPVSAVLLACELPKGGHLGVRVRPLEEKGLKANQFHPEWRPVGGGCAEFAPSWLPWTLAVGIPAPRAEGLLRPRVWGPRDPWECEVTVLQGPAGSEEGGNTACMTAETQGNLYFPSTEQ